jgi:rsbT co-antagonist protein RsbR
MGDADRGLGGPGGTLGQEQLRLLVDNVKEYAIVMLDPEGYIVSWNVGAEQIKGYRIDEVVGKHFSIFYTPEDVAAGKPAMELHQAAAEGRFEDESWRVRKDGSRFWASVVITALRDTDGSLRGFGKLTRDMTERRRLEEKLTRQAREILEISTPVVQLWEGVLALPLIGTLDSQRTQQIMERLLNRIVDTGSPVAIIDLTGVPTVDSQTGRHLIDTIAAVRLLGTQTLLTGIRPEIAQTLVHLGIDLGTVITRSSLASGLRYALDSLGLAVTANNSEHA